MPPSGTSQTSLRPLPGLRSSRLQRLKRLGIFRRANGGLWRIAALAGVGGIAECALGTLQCKDAKLCAPG
eukprot:4184217-Alexandrium_andersonii.AAC.1